MAQQQLSNMDVKPHSFLQGHVADLPHEPPGRPAGLRRGGRPEGARGVGALRGGRRQRPQAVPGGRRGQRQLSPAPPRPRLHPGGPGTDWMSSSRVSTHFRIKGGENLMQFSIIYLSFTDLPIYLELLTYNCTESS